MKSVKLLGWLLSLLLAMSCNSTHPYEEDNQNGGNDPSDPTDVTTGDDLENFDVAWDTSAFEEAAEVIPTDETDPNYDDFIENSTFSSTVTIRYSEGNAMVTNNVSGVTVVQEGAHVIVTSTVKKVEYVLTGTASDGSFKIYSDNKFKLTLNGVGLTNPAGAAINVQSGKRVFVVCNDGTENTLTDGTSYIKTDGEDMKGCFFSEGQLIFSGKGLLTVNGNYKHGICSDDYVRFRVGTRINVTAEVSNGIKANDAVIIGGGALNITAKGDAAKGISCDGYVTVSGGRTLILTTGGGVYEADENDVSACAGIKCDGILTMNAGIVGVKSTGAGGKGISSDGDIVVNGGTIHVITTGQQYVYNRLDTSPKGIKSDMNVTINDGTIKVRTSGGEGSEGIESKDVMTITGGTIEVSAYDDCLNATNNITISGGNIYCYSSGNDGIDSNGTLTITGGVIVSSGTNSPEGGIDCDQNTFTITGGTIIGIGGSNSTPTASACKQPSVIYGGSGTAGTYVCITDSEGAVILAYKIPRTYSQMSLLMSSPDLEKGSNYTLYSGGSASGGTNFHGLVLGGTYTDGSELAGLTLSNMVTTYGSTGGGGGRPGPGR